METERATEMGFCFGVRRALKIVEKASSEYPGLEALGAIVHHPRVVAKLACQGVQIVPDLEKVRGKAVVIPTHGVGEKVLQEIEARGIYLVDTTCPFVRQAQRVARELAKAGFMVVIFGDPLHLEVKGVLGWAEGRGIATTEVDGALRFDPVPHRLGILSQTTQNPSQFARFVGHWAEVLLPQLRKLRVINTICDATQERQRAALELAGKVDLVLVVGGKNSANSRRLAEVCSAAVETHLIETAEELEELWFSGRRRIGITAGASTPDEVIDEVVEKVKQFQKVGSPSSSP